MLFKAFENIDDPILNRALMQFYDAYLVGVYASYRSRHWVSEYGQAADLPLHAYLRTNWNHLDKMYDSLLPENYNLTIQQAMDKLRNRPDLQEKLKEDLKGYKNANVVTFLDLENRSGGIYEILHNQYLAQQTTLKHRRHFIEFLKNSN